MCLQLSTLCICTGRNTRWLSFIFLPPPPTSLSPPPPSSPHTHPPRTDYRKTERKWKVGKGLILRMDAIYLCLINEEMDTIFVSAVYTPTQTNSSMRIDQRGSREGFFLGYLVLHQHAHCISGNNLHTYCTCCHTEIERADLSCNLTQSVN